MKRDLAAMTEKVFDLVVIGGGITGTCIARDAALRGLSVAIVDKGDFAGATTSSSSKLIHGGLRYLQNLEIGLVRESLRERRIWSNTAPHMIDPLPFLMPITRKGLKDRVVKSIGMRLYDWLAYDRNRLDDPEKSLPAHQKLSRKEVLDLEPSLESEDLTGAMLFFDYQMYSPERLALDCLLSAVEAGAVAANYAEVTEFVCEDDRVTGVRVRDTAPRASAPAVPGEYLLRAKVAINAAGPWADILMEPLPCPKTADEPGTAKRRPGRQLIRSKGIHLITRSLTQHHAVAVAGESTHFFILPWRGYSILGTTDTIYRGDPNQVHVTEKDIVNFLAVVNRGFPAAKLRRTDVLFFYAGLRPIVDSGPNLAQNATTQSSEADTYTASRAAEVYDHEVETGLKGMITAIGGKWTTSRALAEHVVDLALAKIGTPAEPCATATTPTYGGAIGRFAEFTRQAITTHPALSREVVEHLARNYGGRMDELLALTQEDPALTLRISPKYPDIGAEVIRAARDEMALTVEDVLFRRTGLGTLGHPGQEVVDRVATLMARELGWSENERVTQVNRAIAKFTSWGRSRAIVNPHSWGDRTGVRWPAIQARLSQAIGPVDAVFTDSPLAAQRLTTQALKEGIEQIIAVGGDGTINEVINGFFENGQPINPEAVFAVLSSGTGGDFRRTLNLPSDFDAQIERLAISEIRPVDLGRLTYTDHNGHEATRYFGNIASFGLSGATDRAVNELTFGKRFGGKLAFQWGVIKALITYRNQFVRLQVDDTFDQIIDATIVAICNGQFFGSGMHIAPNASPSDGVFDIAIIAGAGKIELLRNIGLIYRGEHLNHPRVTMLQGKKITATPVNGAKPLLLDVDGEAPGSLPATFEIVPGALFLRS